MKEAMGHYVYIPNILGVKTDIKHFQWSYGTDAPVATKEQFDKCKVRVFLKVKPDKDVFSDMEKLSFDKRFHCFSVSKSDRTLKFEKKIFGISLRYCISFNANTVNVNVGRSYYNLIRYRIMNFYSVGYLLTDLIEAILLINGYATMYCASVYHQKSGKCVAMFAAPQTGKTLTTIQLCKNHGASFVAEDFAVFDGEKIYGAKWTSSYRLHKKGREGIRSQTRTNMESVVLAPILENAKITDVIVLENGEKKVSEDKAEIADNVLTLNRYGLNYHKAPLVVMLGYFYSEFSPDELYRREKELLTALFEKSRCFKIALRNPEDFALTLAEKVFQDLNI